MSDAALMLDIGTFGAYATALTAVGGVFFGVTKWITKDVSRDIGDVRRESSDLGHKLKNQTARIDAIEHLRTSDIERIVKLESAVQGFEKAVDRIEKGQDRLSDTINDRFDTLAESIREIRSVSPKA